MGFRDILRANPFSSCGAIGTAAYLYQEKYPNFSFREALELSLVETRPGWNSALLELVRPHLDSAETPGEMIEIIVAFEKGLRRQSSYRADLLVASMISAAILTIGFLISVDLSLLEWLVWGAAAFIAAIGVVQTGSTKTSGVPGYLTAGYYIWFLQLVGVVLLPLALHLSPFHLLWWALLSFVAVTVVSRMLYIVKRKR